MALTRRLFVISDLHLGGRPGDTPATGPAYQFNHSYRELIEFIDWIARNHRTAEREQTELVINGDIVDFLAEDDFGAEPDAKVWNVDQGEAIAKLEGIAQRTRGEDGRGVFESLKDLVKSGGRLTFLLGNHDLELGMPEVRAKLLELVGADSGRTKFIYDGEAYVVDNVLIEHGNRYDRWNMVDHSTLRQERSILSRRMKVTESEREKKFFVPPAGTHLVVNVINRIKSRYRFIDLLKPETNAMIPLLVALEPDIGSYLDRMIRSPIIVRQLLKYKLAGPATPYHAGTLGADSPASSGPAGTTSLKQIIEETVGKDDARYFAQPYMNRTDEELSAVTDWMHAKWHQFSEQVSSISSILKIKKASLPDERRRQLHIALKALNETDRSFDLGQEDGVYFQAATETIRQGQFDAVIYGHTHLPKKIAMTINGAKAWYLNTGTWCDVVRLPPALSGTYDSASGELDEFMHALGTNNFERYIKRYLTYAEVVVDQGKTGPEVGLYSFCGAGKERSAPLTSHGPDAFPQRE